MRGCLLAVIAACAPHHVQLDPIPADLTFGQRIEWFNKYAPAYVLRDLSIQCVQQNWGFNCRAVEDRSLILSDGRQVVNPEDLLPLVAEDSEAARDARAARRARSLQRWTGLGGLTIAIAGSVIYYVSRYDDVERYEGNETGRIAGITMIASGLLGAAVGAWFFHSRAEAHTRAAFEHYPAGLAARLRLCPVGFDLAACEDGTKRVRYGPPDPIPTPAPNTVPDGEPQPPPAPPPAT